MGAPQDAATGGAARSTTALLVQGLDELPACEVATRRLLVYVAEDGLFRHCSEAGWQAINLEGKDGADGADGRDGVAVDNTWRDPVTGRLWLIGAYVNRAGAVCPEDWTPPTYLEVKAAYINGLGVALGVLNQADSIWTPTLEDGRFTYLHNSSVSGINQGVTTSAGEQHQLACFQEP